MLSLTQPSNTNSVTHPMVTNSNTRGFGATLAASQRHDIASPARDAVSGFRLTASFLGCPAKKGECGRPRVSIVIARADDTVPRLVTVLEVNFVRPGGTESTLAGSGVPDRKNSQPEKSIERQIADKNVQEHVPPKKRRRRGPTQFTATMSSIKQITFPGVGFAAMRIASHRQRKYQEDKIATLYRDRAHQHGHAQATELCLGISVGRQAGNVRRGDDRQARTGSSEPPPLFGCGRQMEVMVQVAKIGDQRWQREVKRPPDFLPDAHGYSVLKKLAPETGSRQHHHGDDKPHPSHQSIPAPAHPAAGPDEPWQQDKRIEFEDPCCANCQACPPVPTRALRCVRDHDEGRQQELHPPPRWQTPPEAVTPPRAQTTRENSADKPPPDIPRQKGTPRHRSLASPTSCKDSALPRASGDRHRTD